MSQSLPVVCILLLCLVITACTSHEPPKPKGQRFQPIQAISFKALNTQKAVRTGVMRYRQQYENTPETLNMPSLIVDTAILTSAEPQTCAQFIINTDSTYDVDSDQLEIQCYVDGDLVAHNVMEERQRQTKYPYSYRPPTSFESVELMFQVTSRTMQICCPREASNHVLFHFHNRLLGADEDKPWKVSFEWGLKP